MSPIIDTPHRLAVDADGYVWRVNGDYWSMAPTNPDNSPVPEPVTFYQPVDEPASHITTQTTTNEYDDAGRLVRQTIVTVEQAGDR